MSGYALTLTNGTPLVTIPDGQKNDANTSIVLIGKNYAGYGAFLNENFVKMLENFANNSGPANPLKGQLWWDTTNNILKVWSGASWKISTGATSSVSAPGDLSTMGGDLWWDSQNSQLKVYSGATWITIGPVNTTATGDTGGFPVIINDTQPTPQPHFCIEFRIQGTRYAIFSKDSFASALTGFAAIKAGLNFSTTAVPGWVVNATSVQAQYADLAERFKADAVYDAGTVVELGGSAEVTKVSEDLSENVFGVISTSAAYLMNSGAGSDQTHPPIAVQGRVPVKVVGSVKKGDRLVSAGNGKARAGARSELTTWNVIGRALEDKLDTADGTIEAVVKLNS